MKKLLLTLSLIGFAVGAFAQSQAITIPSVAAGATSNSINALIDCRRQQNVAIQWTVGGASPAFIAGTNVSVNIGASVDGITFATNKFSLLMNSTTAPNNTHVTNLNVQGFNYLRVDSVTATGLAATNIVKYSIKPNAP